MRKGFLLAALLALTVSWGGAADQLQWIDRELAEAAAQILRHESLLISYCSLADKARIEVWRVNGVEIVATPVEGLFAIVVSAQPLCESVRPLSSGKPLAPLAVFGFRIPRDLAPFSAEIDLAYIYVPTGDGSFQCLGKRLAAACFVRVETLTLSTNASARTSKRWTQAVQFTWQSTHQRTSRLFFAP